MSYRGIYNGNTLAHYRTKGSRNGYSKDPNYTPIGEKARGPEQHPVYGGAAIAGVGEGVYKRRFDNVKAAPAHVALNVINANEKATRINNMKAAEQRRIAGARDQGAVEAMRRNRMREAEQRRIAGGRTAGTGTAATRFKDAAREVGSNIKNFGEKADDFARSRMKNDKSLKESMNAVGSYKKRQAVINRDKDRMGSTAYNQQTMKNIRSRNVDYHAPNMIKRAFDDIKGGYKDQANAVKKSVTKTAKTAGEVGSSLVKKGKKKVKSLMKRFFG